jgi:radical SAM superfamily enzyme YgiQ (UPF0313 family)
MNVLLVYPEFPDTFWSFKHALPFQGKRSAYPPLGLLTVSALLPKSWEKRVVDLNVRRLGDADLDWADVVFFSGMMVQGPSMKEQIARAKRRGLRTVVGGPIASAQDPAIAEADHVVEGEAEELVAGLAADLERGAARPHYKAMLLPDLTRVPLPDLHLADLRRYSSMAIQYSRGCPFTCEFCDIIVIFGRRPRLKTAEQVCAELDGLAAAGVHDAFIVDDNLIGNKKAIKPILREIIRWQEAHGYPLSFVTEASIDLAEDEEMMQLMLDANIDAVFVGIESPNEEALRETKKIQNLTDRSGTALEKIHRIQDAGLLVWGGTIVGFDHDDETVFDLHRDFIQQSRISQMIVQMLYAIPQTPLHKRLAAEGRLRDSYLMSNWGSAAASNVVPLRLSQQALREGYLKLFRELYTPDAFFARMDAMYLDTKWLPAPGRTSYLRRHRQFRRWLRLRIRAGIQALYIFVQLMRCVPEAELRREYRRRVWNALRHRPNPRLLRVYCIGCAAHLHYDRLITQLTNARPVFMPEAGRDLPIASTATAEAEIVARAAAG